MASEAKPPGRYDRARELANFVNDFGYVAGRCDLDEVRSAWKAVDAALAAIRRRKTGNADVDEWTAKAAEFAKRFRAVLRKEGDELSVYRKYGDNFGKLAEASYSLFADLRDDEPAVEAPPKLSKLGEYPDSPEGHIRFQELFAAELRHAARMKASGEYSNDAITKALHLKQWEEAKRRMDSPGLPEAAATAVRVVLTYPLSHSNVELVAKLLAPAVERLRIEFQESLAEQFSSATSSVVNAETPVERSAMSPLDSSGDALRSLARDADDLRGRFHRITSRAGGEFALRRAEESGGRLLERIAEAGLLDYVPHPDDGVRRALSESAQRAENSRFGLWLAFALSAHARQPERFPANPLGIDWEGRESPAAERIAVGTGYAPETHWRTYAEGYAEVCRGIAEWLRDEAAKCGAATVALPNPARRMLRLRYPDRDDPRLRDLWELRASFSAWGKPIGFSAYRYQDVIEPDAKQAPEGICRVLSAAGRLLVQANVGGSKDRIAIYCYGLPRDADAIRLAFARLRTELGLAPVFGGDFAAVFQFLSGVLTFPPLGFTPGRAGDGTCDGLRRFEPFDFPTIEVFERTEGRLIYANGYSQPRLDDLIGGSPWPARYATAIDDVCFAIRKAIDALIEGRLAERRFPFACPWTDNPFAEPDPEAEEHFRDRWGLEIAESQTALRHVLKAFYEPADSSAVAHTARPEGIRSGRMPAVLSAAPQLELFQHALATIASAVQEAEADPAESNGAPAKSEAGTGGGKDRRDIRPTDSKPAGLKSRRKERRKSGIGRPAKYDVAFIAALTSHHRYANGTCEIFEPISSSMMQSAAAGCTANAVTRFFERVFKGAGRPQQRYEAACRNRARLIAELMRLNRDFPSAEALGIDLDNLRRDDH